MATLRKRNEQFHIGRSFDANDSLRRTQSQSSVGKLSPHRVTVLSKVNSSVDFKLETKDMTGQQGLRISQSVTKLKEPEVDEVFERQPKVLATEKKRRTERVYKSLGQSQLKRITDSGGAGSGMPSKRLVKNIRLSQNFKSKRGSQGTSSLML